MIPLKITENQSVAVEVLNGPEPKTVFLLFFYQAPLKLMNEGELNKVI